MLNYCSTVSIGLQGFFPKKCGKIRKAEQHKKHLEFKNQKAKAIIKIITDAYAKHMMKNDFLN